MTITELLAQWSAERQGRQVTPTAHRSGFDTAIVDTHIVDPAWIAARRRVESLGLGR